LATYVPPHVLTNADLEKLVDTTDEWIQQRTGIRERHIVDRGVATSDLGKEAALKAIANAGLTPDQIEAIIVGHGDAGHDVSVDGVSGAAQDRRPPRLGIRSQRRVLRVHLLGHDRRASWWRAARTIACSWSAPT
jgi:hypothetical protein